MIRASAPPIAPHHRVGPDLDFLVERFHLLLVHKHKNVASVEGLHGPLELLFPLDLSACDSV